MWFKKESSVYFKGQNHNNSVSYLLKEVEHGLGIWENHGIKSPQNCDDITDKIVHQ